MEMQTTAVQIHDTNGKDPVQHFAGQVDCSLLASELRRWTSMFPLSSSLMTQKAPQLWVNWSIEFKTLCSSSQVASTSVSSLFGVPFNFGKSCV